MANGNRGRRPDIKCAQCGAKRTRIVTIQNATDNQQGLPHYESVTGWRYCTVCGCMNRIEKEKIGPIRELD